MAEVGVWVCRYGQLAEVFMEKGFVGILENFLKTKNGVVGKKV